MRRAIHIDERRVFARVTEIGARAELLVVVLGAFGQPEVVLVQEIEELLFEAGVAKAFQLREMLGAGDFDR